MTTQEVAGRYVELFRSAKAAGIHDTLYSEDVICKEPEHAAAFGTATLTEGLAAIKAKTKDKQEAIKEIHSFYCSDPVIGGNYFSVAMGREFTLKNGQKRKMDEIAVFGVKDGKIVSETFFY